MTRQSRDPRRSVPILVVPTLAALALSGCGSAAKTNGLEKLPARTVQQQALAALKSARTAHVRGTSLVAGSVARIDVRFSGHSSTGVIAAEGLRFAFTRVGDITYIKASRRGLQTLGAPVRVRHIAADRWLKLAPSQVSLSGISLPELADQFAESETGLDPQVSRSTVDGKPVVVVTKQNGSKLYVSNTGPAYPVRGDYEGQAAARFEFTEFGAAIRVTAPKQSIDSEASRELSGPPGR